LGGGFGGSAFAAGTSGFGPGGCDLKYPVPHSTPRPIKTASVPANTRPIPPIGPPSSATALGSWFSVQTNACVIWMVPAAGGSRQPDLRQRAAGLHP